MHDRCRLVAVLVIGQFLQNLGLFHAGQGIHAGALDRISVGAVAIGAGGSQIAAEVRVSSLRGAGKSQQAHGG